tara:strand:- start:2594 stop:2992 length:399 start_codon:yes stop_codon:yes gene_type:complete
MNTEANEQLTTALTGAINKTVSAVEAAAEFLNQQSPEVIEQLLRWNFAKSLIFFVLYAGLAVLALTVTCVLARKAGELEKDKDDAEVTAAALFLYPFVVVVLLALAVKSLDWMQILIAEKVWLLEYAARVVN